MQLDLEFRDRDAVEPSVHNVGDLTREIRELLEENLTSIWVRGEISNLRRQASGHLYFTLKDPEGQLACVLFAGTARNLKRVRLEDGVAVRLLGDVTVYPPQGKLQMVVRKAEEEGAGALQAKFEQLKQRLAEEGLFDSSRKRPLPRIPRRIGLVTSPTGAAIRDFLQVLGRRCPSIEVIIHPVRVQGRGAAAQIAAAVRNFAEWEMHGLPEVDVVVLTRGGGSIEDLWEFNEEVVARAVAECPIPVVSAVGHEIDFTICDFAADFRAPTPSAAAEILSPDAAEWIRTVAAMTNRMRSICTDTVALLRANWSGLVRSALGREVPHQLREWSQTLDVLSEALDFQTRGILRTKQFELNEITGVLRARRPSLELAACRNQVATLSERLPESAQRRLDYLRTRSATLRDLLDAFGPESAMRRGYTITTDPNGNILRSRETAINSAKLHTRFADGVVISNVERHP